MKKSLLFGKNIKIQWHDYYEDSCYVTHSVLFEDGRSTGIRIIRRVYHDKGKTVWEMRDRYESYGEVLQLAIAKAAMLELWKQSRGLIRKRRVVNPALFYSKQKELPFHDETGVQAKNNP